MNRNVRARRYQETPLGLGMLSVLEHEASDVMNYLMSSLDMSARHVLRLVSQTMHAVESRVPWNLKISLRSWYLGPQRKPGNDPEEFHKLGKRYPWPQYQALIKP